MTKIVEALALLVVFSLSIFVFITWQKKQEERQQQTDTFQALGFTNPKLLKKKKLKRYKEYQISFGKKVNLDDVFAYYTQDKDVEIFARRTKYDSWTNITRKKNLPFYYVGDSKIWVKVSKNALVKFYLGKKELKKIKK